MLKLFIPLFFIILFNGCSFKIPFFSFTDELEEANVCKENYLQKDKIDCYEELEDNSYAQLRLGIYYANKKSFEKALSYLNKSYENDNIYSNLALSYLYFQGNGVKKDLKKSFELLKEASSIDPNAAFQLSRFYLKGIETSIDLNKAIELLDFAASRNMLNAQKRLFDIYTYGFGNIKKDELKAKYWEEKIKENKKDTTYDIYTL